MSNHDGSNNEDGIHDDKNDEKIMTCDNHRNKARTTVGTAAATTATRETITIPPATAAAKTLI